MKTIYKYALAIADEQQIEVPVGAEFLSVQMQHGRLCVWAIVDTERLNEIQYFVIYGTGEPIPNVRKFLHYLGTVQQEMLVWHVFRVVR